MKTMEQISQQWAQLRGWPGQMKYLIALGDELPGLSDSERCEGNRVDGCESLVWLVSDKDHEGVRHWRADSEARIIRGLIALVLSALNDKTQADAQAVDIEQWFSELGLLRHLSPSRGNGLRAIVARIQQS